MNQIDLQELKESTLLLDDLLTEVIKEEGTLAGGRKLERRGEALLGVKESRLSLGHPTDNLVKLTPELFSELGLELNPIQRRQMESQFDFYYLTLKVLLMPKRGATFIVQSIFPTSQWRPVLESGSGLQLALDANLEWVVGIDGKRKAHIIVPDFSMVRSEIAAVGSGNHYCYWRLSDLGLQKRQSVQFATLFTSRCRKEQRRLNSEQRAAPKSA